MPCHEQVCLIMFNEKYYFERYFFHHWAIVGIPPPPFLQRRVEPPTKFSKRWGGLTGPQILDGDCWERGGDFFQEGLQLSHKNKLKSEIYNDEKNYKQKYISVIQTGKIYLRI